MNIFDIIIILFIISFGVVGLKRGVIKEGVSFIGILLVFIISYSFKGIIGNTLCKLFPFFALEGNLEGLVSVNILIYQLLGFAILFGILMIAYNILVFFSKILQKFINATIVLTIPSAIGGALVGLIKGYLLAFIALLVLSLPLKNVALLNDSTVKNHILYNTPVISSATKDISLSILDVTDLLKQIKEKSISTNDANLQILDTMLEYKMVDVHTIDQLIVLDKLKSISDIDSVLNKYREG